MGYLCSGGSLIPFTAYEHASSVIVLDVLYYTNDAGWAGFLSPCKRIRKIEGVWYFSLGISSEVRLISIGAMAIWRLIGQ